MSKFPAVSRRGFLLKTAATAVGAVLLKGCGGSSTADVAEVPTLPIPEGQGPETTKIVLGFIPIVESAPLVIAHEKGFFARYGMTEVEISKQANWASARDNVVIGSAGGGIDGGQWQMPLPHLIHKGVITLNNEPVPMALLCKLNTQGNGIAISNTHAGKGIGLDVSKAADYIKGLPANEGRRFKAAYTFPNVNQDFWIRYWLAAGGINPDKDIDLLAVPPAETMMGMRNGTMDAFSTGDPWPGRIVPDEIGFMACLTHDIWKFHPEEYFAIRADWVEANPKATKALLKAIMEAQQWCDDPKNRAELVEICAARSYFNVYTDVLTRPYKGTYLMGDGKPDVNDFKSGPLYWQDPLGSVSYPYKSHDLWFLTESLRWGFHRDAIPDFDASQKLIDEVNREDLWREAAKEAGFSSGIPGGTSRGVEEFFDGVTFDPENPQAYLDSLTIKAA
jgi:bicarbonate transport system substrate-binding protein